MSPELEELPLPAGRMTRGVVRVGDTVRRPRTQASPFVSRLLAHLEAQACSWAPRYLGTDEQGRDTFSYFEGTVAAKWRNFADAPIVVAARMIRHLHDVTFDSELSPDAVVCHHDPGPNNFVFADGLPNGLIDFDMAAPGDRAEDVGYLAWSWCISANPLRHPVAIQAAQVRLVADAYGADSDLRARLLDATIERQLRNAQFWTARLREPGTLTPPAKILEIIEWSEQQARHTERHRPTFERALLA